MTIVQQKTAIFAEKNSFCKWGFQLLIRINWLLNCMWDSRISIVNIEAGYSILYVQEGTDAGSCSIHLMSLQIPASHSTGQRNFRCGHWVLTLTMLGEILQKNCWNITDNNGFININNVILQNILLFLTINLEMLAPISWWTKK